MNFHSSPIAPALGVCAVAIALVFISGDAAASNDEVNARVASGVQAWASDSGVVVTDDVVKLLSVQANAAVTDIASRNTLVTRQRLEDVAPRAVIAHLERSQKSGRAPPVAGLIEQLATNAGALLPAVTDFPTLKIVVLPPEPADFIVSIDGHDFASGASTFRVARSAKHAVVSHAGKAICDFKLDLASTGSQTETCRRS